MFGACIRITDKHVDSSNLSITSTLLYAYKLRLICSITVIDYDRTKIYETYEGSELHKLMASQFEHQSFLFVKRKQY